jgi:hypothetical protein
MHAIDPKKPRVMGLISLNPKKLRVKGGISPK